MASVLSCCDDDDQTDDDTATSSVWLSVHLENRSDGSIDALVLEPLGNIGVATLHKAVLLQQICEH